MPFINEYIPTADIEKYGIKEIDQRFLKLTFQPDWTVDRELDVYLRKVGSGREEFANEATYTFFWKGSLIVVRLLEQGDGVRGGVGWSEYKLKDVELNSEQTKERQQILDALKDALKAYNGGGVYSTRTSTEVSFDF